MTGLSIGEVARRSGLRTSAIRYYEKIGLLPRAPRTRFISGVTIHSFLIGWQLCASRNMSDCDSPKSNGC